MIAKNIAVIFDMYKKILILILEGSNCDLKCLSKGHICIIELRSWKLAYLDSLWNPDSKYI